MTGTVVNHNKMSPLAKYLANKLQSTYCTTVNTHNNLCHDNHCHNTTSYLHGCDIYNDDQCDNLTVRYNAYNSTGWRNTTCNLHACYKDVSDDCWDGNLNFESCTNGNCRNGLTHIHGCISFSHDTKDPDETPFLFGLDIENGLNDIFDAPCVNYFYYIYRQSRLSSSK